MRRFLTLLFALALLTPGALYAQPEDDAADVDDADDDVDDEEASEGEAPKARSRSTADEDPPPDVDDDEAPRKKSAKAKRAKETEADPDEPSEPKADPEPPAREAPAKKVLAEKAVDDGRPALRQRAASVLGPTGLDRVWSADPGAEGTFRLGFALRWFDVEDWPISGSDDTFTGTHFALAWTPVEFLETFLAITSSSNENAGSQPGLLQTQGDVDVGVKAGWFVSETLALGLGGRLHAGSGPGTTGFDLDALSAEVRALLTADFARAGSVPLRILLDVAYYLENGEAVYAGQAQEPDLVQEWGLQAWRYDRLTLGLGFEVPASPYVSPFAEYRIGTPFQVQLSRRGRGAIDFDFASVPHTITGGLRAFPTPAVALDAAFRYGVSDLPFTGVESTPPWELVFGLSYTLDPRPKVIERSVAPEKPVAVSAPTVSIIGKVVDAKTGDAIEGAAVAFEAKDRKRSPLLSGAKGIVQGYRFKPGTVRVRLTAKGYLPTSKKVRLKEGKDRKIKFKMKPDPKAQAGTLEVRAFGPKGKPMGAKVIIDDPAITTGEITPDAPMKVELDAGSYTLTVDTKGFKTVKQQVLVVGGESRPVRVAMQRGRGVLVVGVDGKKPPMITPRRSGLPPPPAPLPRAGGGGGGGGGALAAVKGRLVVPRGRVEFEEGSAKLTGAARKALDSVAALMKRDAGIKKLRVDAHTDGRGDAATKRALSAQQAKSVQSYLVSRGVARNRLSAKGFGPDKPIAPNMSARGRAKNRRVELTILEMDR